MHDPTSFVIYASREAIMELSIAIAFAWVLGGLLVLSPFIEPHLPRPPIPMIFGTKFSVFIGALGILAGALFSLTLATMMRYPALVVDETGIHRPPRLTIPWEDIQQVECKMTEQTVLITLRSDADITPNPYRLMLKSVTPDHFETVCDRIDQHVR